MFNTEFASIPSFFWILLGLTLVITAIGFYRTVYFISIGYAFSITTMAIATSAVYRDRLTWVTAAQCIGLALWGVRLGVYLIWRDSVPAYNRQRKENDERSQKAPRLVQFFMWISVSPLFVTMFCPALFQLSGSSAASPTITTLVQAVGLVVMFGGIIVEGIADRQKSNFKAQNPAQFCNVGLYRWVRCPNYLGEILFWFGNWIVSLTFYSSILQWVLSLIGIICLIQIMIGSTKRLERTQAKRYNDLPEYQTYIKTVPVLFPYLPIYTLQNIRVNIE